MYRRTLQSLDPTPPLVGIACGYKIRHTSKDPIFNESSMHDRMYAGEHPLVSLILKRNSKWSIKSKKTKVGMEGTEITVQYFSPAGFEAGKKILEALKLSHDIEVTIVSNICYKHSAVDESDSRRVVVNRSLKRRSPIE